jgi:hypothetical protein
MGAESKSNSKSVWLAMVFMDEFNDNPTIAPQSACM